MFSRQYSILFSIQCLDFSIEGSIFSIQSYSVFSLQYSVFSVNCQRQPGRQYCSGGVRRGCVRGGIVKNSLWDVVFPGRVSRCRFPEEIAHLMFIGVHNVCQ